MQKILGIDLGATAIKAVAIESSFRSQAVRGYRSEAVPPPEPPVEGQPPKTYAERALPALEALKRDGWFEADQIICSLPGAQVAGHIVTLPFLDRKQIDATLPGEIEALIPFNPEDVVFDSHIVWKGGGKTELLVGVAQHAQVQGVIDLLQGVGVDPSVVTFSALALANLTTEGYVPVGKAEIGATEPVVEAILDLGAERTNILILENGEPRFARAASLGGNDITSTIARALDIPWADAEGTKRSVDLTGGGEPTITTVAERAVSALIREIRATFTGYSTRTRRKISRIQITGGGARLLGLPAFLTNAFGIPVEPLSFRPDFTFPEQGETATGALALALALRGVAGSKAPKVNFRRGRLSYAREVGETRGLYAGLAAMAAILLVLFGVSVWAKLQALETREAKLDKALCDATKKILGSCETDFRVAIGKLKGQGSPAASIPHVSAVELLSNVSNLFPTGGSAVLNDLDIVDGSIRLRGDATSYDAIDDIIVALQADKCMTDVKKGKLEKTAAGRVDFALDVTYGCSGVTKEGS